jgi:dTDP-4-amino-4,6-dideoxygalactose transaminase
MLAVKFKPQLDCLNLDRVNKQHHNEITRTITQVLETGTYIRGEATSLFENKFAAYIGCEYCVGVANVQDALRLIIRAYVCLGKLKKGNSILVPHNAFISTVLAVVEEGLRPILVPPSLDSYSIDTSQLDAFVQSDTKAILPVHFYGMPCFSEELKTFADKYDLLVIEDNAQAVGATYKDKKTGNLGNAACVSFSPESNLGAVGEGGAVLTNDASLYAMVRLLSGESSNINSQYKYKGINSSLAEMQAAILTVKLKYLDAHNHFRNVVADYYNRNIKTPFIALPNVSEDCRHVWSCFVIRTCYRNELRDYLKKNKVATVINDPVIISKLEAFPSLYGFNCERTVKLNEEILSLPIGPVMYVEEIEYIVTLLNSFRPSI